MAIQPLYFKPHRKTTKMSLWRKIEIIMAILSVIGLIISIILGAIMTNNANERADTAYASSQILQTELNSILNNSLTQANIISNQSLLLAQIANNLTQTGLQLQNTTLNYQPEIIPYSLVATLDDMMWNNESTPTFGAGNFNLSLIVITPHAGVIYFTDPSPFSFSVWNDSELLNGASENGWYPWLNPDNLSLAHVDFSFGGYANNGNGRFYNYPQDFEAFVQPGITQVNFTVPIDASFYVNQNWINSLDGKLVDGLINFNSMGNFSRSLVFNTLGSIATKIDFWDLQTMSHTDISFLATLNAEVVYRNS